ncbi:MAG TPA: hypothetical protein VLA49_05560 [Anaerolineales bacterium]|nr:hypothetical protein [Anaerolineales bacterium]
MTRTRLIGGILLIAFSLAFIGVFVLESSRVQLGFEDGDNPEQSVAFLKEYGVIYEVSGTLQIMMSAALVISVLVVANTFSQETPDLPVNISSVFGIFAAAAYFLNGALRLAAARPLLYIDSLNHDWGITAYLVVQMVGIQGFAQAAIVNLGFWAVSLSLISVRRRFFPKAIALLAAFPAFHLFAAILLPFLGEPPSALFLLYVFSIFGTVLWCLVLGIFLTRFKTGSLR